MSPSMLAARAVLLARTNGFLGVLALTAFAAGSLGVVSWYLSGTARTKRALRRAKAWQIGALPEDTLGRVIGRAQPVERPLTAPLTGRTCVYYIAIVEQRGSNTDNWREVLREEEGVPFVLDDGSGRAIVDPGGATVALDFDGDSESGTFDDATPAEEAFLARHGKKSTGWLFNKDLRYREAIIEVGETVAVLGAGVREPDPEPRLRPDDPGPGYRSAPQTRLRLMSSTKLPLLISDDRSTLTTS